MYKHFGFSQTWWCYIELPNKYAIQFRAVFPEIITCYRFILSNRRLLWYHEYDWIDNVLYCLLHCYLGNRFRCDFELPRLIWFWIHLNDILYFYKLLWGFDDFRIGNQLSTTLRHRLLFSGRHMSYCPMTLHFDWSVRYRYNQTNVCWHYYFLQPDGSVSRRFYYNCINTITSSYYIQVAID